MPDSWKFVGAVLTAGLLFTSVHSHAGDGISYQQASLLAATCFACHGTDGRMAEAIDPLAGRSYQALRATLMAFRDDQIPNATVMNRIAAGYSEEEIDAIATYFSGLPAGRE